MNTSRMGLIAILVLSAGLLHEAPALGQSPSCYVAPSMGNIFIFVRELDQDSNPLGEIGSGWVNQGDRLPVTSQTGQISINYRPASSDKMVKMDPTGCSGGQVIQVP